MPTHLTFSTELIDTVAHFTRMLRHHKSDGFIQNRHSKTFMAAKNPRKLRLSKKNMGKRWVKTDTEIICHIQDKRKGRKDSYLRGSVSHRKFLLSHKPSKAIVFILIKHGVFDCKVHKQKRHVKVGSFRMVTLHYDEICRRYLWIFISKMSVSLRAASQSGERRKPPGHFGWRLSHID